MNKNKILTGIKKQGLSKTMVVEKKEKPKFNLSTKMIRKKDLIDLDTSRTNKQNVIEKTQVQLPKTSKYLDRYEQKKEYLSQSMVLNEIPYLLTSKDNSRIKMINKEGLNEARNELKNLLSVNEVIQQNTFVQPIDVKDVIESLIYESIIKSQQSKIHYLQSQISQLTSSLQIFTQPKYLSFHQTISFKLQPTKLISPFEQSSTQISILTRQTQSLKKQILTYRKDSALIKKQLSTLKKNHEFTIKQLDILKINYQNCQQQLHDKSIWLSTLKFQNQQLLKQPNLIITQLNEQKLRLMEYIYGINKSYDYLSIKLNSLKRESQIELKEIKAKYNEDIKKLRDKLRKKTTIERQEKKKKQLRIKVEQESNLDDSLDWNLQQQDDQKYIKGEVIHSC